MRARKALDGIKLGSTGWGPKIDLDGGIKSTYEWFQAQFSVNTELRGY